MALDLIELTALLEINDHDIEQFRDQLMNVFKDPLEVKKVMDRQCKERGKPNCQACKSKGECRIVYGAAYLMLGDVGNAKENIEYAKRYFSRKDDTWNSIICMALLGLAFAQNGEMREASSQAQDALLRLERVFLRIHAKDYPVKAYSLTDDLREFISNPPPPPQTAQPSAVPPKKGRILDQAKLVFPSLQVFSGVRAGPNGPIWDQLPKNPKALVDRIILDDCLHDLYSVSTGNQISINPDKKYGWVKVEGDSMEASKPVGILDGDYVLFSESSDADDGCIVIAAFSDDKRAGYKFAVKRYSKSDGLLISETKPPNKYDPLPLKKNTTIIATVIAVAKLSDE